MRSETAPDLVWSRAAVVTAWWATVATYAGAIFVASSSAHPFGIQRLPPGADKLIHAVIFGGFSWTLWRALRCSAPRASGIGLSVLAALIAAAYGVTDEIHQSFVPGRDMDPFDLAADAIGASGVQAIIVMRCLFARQGPAEPR